MNVPHFSKAYLVRLSVGKRNFSPINEYQIQISAAKMRYGSHPYTHYLTSDINAAF